jgi:hypothetical protein
MAHHAQCFGVLGGQQPERNLALLGEQDIRPNDLIIDLGSKRRFGQPRPDLGGNIKGANAVREFQNRGVGQLDFNHFLQILYFMLPVSRAVDTKDAAEVAERA